MSDFFFSLITPAEGFELQAAHEWSRGAPGHAGGNAYEDHRQLWRFFPAPRGEAREFVFRRRDDGGLPRFYIVSQRPPQAPSPAWEVRSRLYAPRLSPGARLRFDLRANPVITTPSADGARRQRHDVVMHEKKRLLVEQGLARWADWPGRPALPELVQRACAAWLVERAERLGCAFEELSLAAEGYTQHRGKSARLRFSSIDLSGDLTVTDPAAFTAALLHGVGHAKAFGCGLLLVRPLR